jgi:hypothetical protein
MRIYTLLLAALCLLITGRADGLDHVSLMRDGKPLHLSGKLLMEAQNGGLLLLAPDGVIWAVQPEEIVSHTRDNDPFEPLPRDEMAEKLLAELPDGFRTFTTANYLICYNTSPAYAQWCGALYERLYKGFHNYWKLRGFRLHDPELPLVALVFENKSSYAAFTRSELGEAAGSITGYYSLTTNRVNMYDLTGVEGFRRPGERISTAARVNQILSQPAAAPTVATIVHEATHQLAYNCGLQTRMADNPMWVSEGIALYFETPDLSNSKGWGSIGSLNRGRLIRFRTYLRERPSDSLLSLLREDGRFRDPATAVSAYAEAWALNYYLLRTRSEQYVDYLKLLAEKQPSIFDQPDQRLAQFRAIFGSDLEKFDEDFLRFIRNLR